MSEHKSTSVEDEMIDRATATPSPLERVKQHQAEVEQSLQQHNDNVDERPADAKAEIIGQGVPNDRKHHPQRTQF